MAVKFKRSGNDEGTVSGVFSEEQQEYDSMYQNNATAALVEVGRKNTKTDEVSGRSTSLIRGISTMLPVGVESLSPQSKRLYTYIARRLTKQLDGNKRGSLEPPDIKRRTVSFCLNEYMEACGITSKQKAKESLIKSLGELLDIKQEFDAEVWPFENGRQSKKAEKRHFIWHLFSGASRPADMVDCHGNFTITFDELFAWDTVNYSYPMLFASNLDKTDLLHYPDAQALGYELMRHHNMNITKTNNSSVSTSALLEACPNIPSYDEIMQSSRQVYDRIIAPFDADLEHLVDAGVLSEFSYYLSDNKPFERGDLGGISYDNFIKLMVHYELKDYPDQTKRLEDAADRKEKAKKRARKKATEQA